MEIKINTNVKIFSEKLKSLKKSCLLLLSIIFCLPLLAQKGVSDKTNIEAESSKLIEGAFKVSDQVASGGYVISLMKANDGVTFLGLPASSKLAVSYASSGVGLVNVAINNKPIQNLNVHSTGSLTESFLHAIIDIEIPANASITISLVTNNITVNFDKIVVGFGDLGLPPDIWNLSSLPVNAGVYPTEWKGLSRLYTVPEWWRDAKFGAWSHWDPQSMPEQGDWYARGMYIQGNRRWLQDTVFYESPTTRWD